MNNKYYNGYAHPRDLVSFKFIDEENNGFAPRNSQACFSSIFFNEIPAKAKKILVFHNLANIPYSKKLIERWVQDITEFGFPMTVSFTEEEANFFIDLNEYKSKLQVCSALTLIRCLLESNICQIPAVYFESVDNNKGGFWKKKHLNLNVEERFLALQEAHKKVHQKHVYLTTGHMVTHKKNFSSPLPLKKLSERLENNKTGVFSSERGGTIWGLWGN